MGLQGQVDNTGAMVMPKTVAWPPTDLDPVPSPSPLVRTYCGRGSFLDSDDLWQPDSLQACPTLYPLQSTKLGLS